VLANGAIELADTDGLRLAECRLVHIDYRREKLRSIMGSNEWLVAVLRSWVFAAPLVLTSCTGLQATQPTPDAADTEGTTNGGTQLPYVTGAQWTSPIGATWTWYDVPGTLCGNGTPTGYAVSRPPANIDSGEVFIYLEGGSGCFDYLTCNSGLAANFKTGYSFATLQGDTLLGPNLELFKRTDASAGAEANPYNDATWVFVPYCTGDLHTGDTTQSWGPLGTGHYNGRINLDKDLAHYTSHYSAPTRVTLAGSSAGGFGAEILYEYVRTNYFPTASRVDLVIDSAPFFDVALPLLTLAENPVAYSNWDAVHAFPAGCSNCYSHLNSLYAYYDSKYSDSSFAFLEHDEDFVIATLAYLESPFPNFYFDIKRFTTETLAPLQHTKYFIPGNNGAYAYAITHGVLGYDPVGVSVQPRALVFFQLVNVGPPTSLGTWIGQMRSGSASWADQTNQP
jgi:hypothetical protein